MESRSADSPVSTILHYKLRYAKALHNTLLNPPPGYIEYIPPLPCRAVSGYRFLRSGISERVHAVHYGPDHSEVALPYFSATYRNLHLKAVRWWRAAQRPAAGEEGFKSRVPSPPYQLLVPELTQASLESWLRSSRPATSRPLVLGRTR